MPTAMNTPYALAIYANGELDGPEIGTLVVVVDKARNLPNRRTMGKQDPYFNARLGKEAKKTNADKRGGQTPKWDSELRFTVHDSADYYTMKVSLFDEGKRTELIGDAWVDLKAVVVAGGGEAEIWQELKCKGKYAGEVRLELTYYDSRPKTEKPAPKKQPSKVFDDANSPVGSARGRTPVKRRPLPSNPASMEQPRSFASGPREYGAPAQARSTPPASQRRTVYDNHGPLPVQTHQSSNGFYSGAEDHDPFTVEHEYQPAFTHDQQQTLFPQHEDYNHGYVDEQYAYAPSVSEQSTFLPQLPPMNRTREMSSGRSSRMQQMPDHSDRFIAEPSIEMPQHHQEWPSASDQPQYYEDTSNYDPQSQAMNPREFLHQRYGSDEGYDLHQAQQFHGEHPQIPEHLHQEPEFAPPPPLHRASISNESQHYSNRSRGSQGSWHDGHQRRGSTYSNLSQRSQGAASSMRAKSEMSLVRHSSFMDPQPEWDNHCADMDDHRQRSFSEEPGQAYAFNQSSTQTSGHRSGQSSPMRRDMPHTPRSTGSFSNDDQLRSTRASGDFCTARDSRSSKQLTQHIPMHTPPQHSTSMGQYSQHARHGSFSHASSYSSARPHPLSQQQDVLSSSPHSYLDGRNDSYGSANAGMPLIKPLAISPRKSQPVTPSSADRQVRSHTNKTVSRKSVSPHPGSGSADRLAHFSAYGPESYSVLNPGSTGPKHREVDPSAPIVDFHGNIIDPSDRLPEASWAPEPTKPAKELADDDLPMSTWAPEPERRPEPRMIAVRTREVPPRATRTSYAAPSSPMSPSSGYNIRSPPEHRSSMSMTSPPPVGSPASASPTTTPHTRNRLRKLNRPQSMVAMPTTSKASYAQPGWAPPIPAKVPIDQGNRSLVRYATSQMDSLSLELQNIDIGSGSDARRIGGRRLLEYRA